MTVNKHTKTPLISTTDKNTTQTSPIPSCCPSGITTPSPWASGSQWSVLCPSSFALSGMPHNLSYTVWPEISKSPRPPAPLSLAWYKWMESKGECFTGHHVEGLQEMEINQSLASRKLSSTGWTEPNQLFHWSKRNQSCPMSEEANIAVKTAAVFRMRRSLPRQGVIAQSRWVGRGHHSKRMLVDRW